jgi:hypothetical protein
MRSIEESSGDIVEEDEISSGLGLFRVTVWAKDGKISDYERYAASPESAVRHQKGISKLMKVEKLGPRNRAILDCYYYE